MGEFAGLAVNAVNCFFLYRLHSACFGLVAFVIHEAAVAGIGKPNAAIRMHHCIIRGVELFAAKFVSQNGNLAVVLVTHHTAVTVLAGNLAAFIVKRVSIAVAAGMAKLADMAIFLQPAHLDIVRNIAPQKIFPHTIPRRPLGPEHIGVRVQSANGCIAKFVFCKQRIQHQHIRLGITRGGFTGPITIGNHRRGRKRRGSRGQKTAAI